MTSSALLTLITIVASIEGSQARVEGDLFGYLEVGDRGRVEYQITVGSEKRTIEVGDARVLEVGNDEARVRIESDRQVLKGFAVRFELPLERVEANGLAVGAGMAVALAAARADLTTAVESGKILSTRVGELERELAMVRSEGTAAERASLERVQRAESELADARAAVEAAEAARATTATQLEELEEEAGRLELGLSAAAREKQRLESALAETGGKLLERDQELAAMREEGAASLAQANQLRQQLETEQQTNEKGTARTIATEKRLEAVLAREEALSARVEGLEEELAEARTALARESDDSQASLEELGQRLETLQSELHAERGLRTASEAVAAEGSKAVTELQEKVAGLEGELAAERTRAADLDAALGESETKLAAARASRDSCEQGLAEVNEKLSEAQNKANEPASVDATGELVEEHVLAADPPSLAEIETVVLAWATAWSEQDIETYLGFYSPHYRPAGGETRTAWATVRRERLARPEFIKVTIQGLRFLEAGSAAAEVRFEQHYRSSTFEDLVTKTMALGLEGHEWKIVREEVQ